MSGWAVALYSAPFSHNCKVIEPDQVGGEKLHTTIAELIQMAENSNDNDIVRLLNEILPEAEIGSAPPPEFTSIA